VTNGGHVAVTIDPTIVVACISATGTVIAAALAVRSERNHRGVRTRLEAIAADASTAKEQVTNTHKTNFRDDLDRVERKVDRVLDKVEILHDQVVVLNEADITAEREHASLWRAIRKIAS
jgi:hypothetical protein